MVSSLNFNIERDILITRCPNPVVCGGCTKGRKTPGKKKGVANTAHSAALPPGYFKVVHPFHPFAGQVFEIHERRKIQKRDCVIFFHRSGEKRIIPAIWTDLSTEADAFKHISAGRANFRYSDLTRIAELIRAFSGIENQERGDCSVKEISPQV